MWVSFLFPALKVQLHESVRLPCWHPIQYKILIRIWLYNVYILCHRDRYYLVYICVTCQKLAYLILVRL